MNLLGECYIGTVSYTMNTIKTVLTTTILTLFLANCVQLDFIVNCKTVGQNKNIKENKDLVFYTFSRRYLGNLCGTTDHNCHNIPLFVSKSKLCCRTHRGINIRENKEAPDKQSWSVTIANQDTYKSSISTTSMMVLTRKTKKSL
jgi:hypothetical protein